MLSPRGWEPWNLIMVRSAFDMRSPVTLQQKVQSGLLAGLGRFSDLVEVMELKGGNAGIGIKFNEFLGLGKSRSGKKKKKLLLKLYLPHNHLKGSLKHRGCWVPPQNAWFSRFGVESEGLCISNQFPGSADAAGPGTTFWEPLLYWLPPLLDRQSWCCFLNRPLPCS